VDKRTAIRIPVSKSEAGGSEIRCLVRNISDTATALDITSPVEIPRAFHASPAGGRRSMQNRVHAGASSSPTSNLVDMKQQVRGILIDADSTGLLKLIEAISAA
jgi:hypothetical protein